MKTIYIVTCLLLGFMMSAAHAGKLPSGYPEGFSHAAKLNSVDANKLQITIGDRNFRTAAVTIVHELNGQKHALSAGDAGSEVGINVHSIMGGTVKEMWILPRGYLSTFKPKWVE